MNGGNAREKMLDLLKANGFHLARRNKHLCWKDARGRLFVMSGTPSDFRANLIELKRLERLLGVEREKGSGERREKKPDGVRRESVILSSPSVAGGDWRSALQSYDPFAKMRLSFDVMIEGAYVRAMKRIAKIWEAKDRP